MLDFFILNMLAHLLSLELLFNFNNSTKSNMEMLSINRKKKIISNYYNYLKTMASYKSFHLRK